MGDVRELGAGVVGDGWPTADEIHDFDWVTLPPSARVGTFDAPSGLLAAAEWGPDDGSPVLALPIQEVAPEIEVVGPVPELVEEIRALHQAAAQS